MFSLQLGVGVILVAYYSNPFELSYLQVSIAMYLIFVKSLTPC